MRQTVKTIFAVLMLIAATFTFSACEQDSPENVHSTSELAGAWTWRTEQGDAGTCDVSISTINNSIVIQNFQNQGSSEAITASLIVRAPKEPPIINKFLLFDLSLLIPEVRF